VSDDARYERRYLLQLLELRKDRRWRLGLIQGFRCCDVITQREWEVLRLQINRRELSPHFPAERDGGEP